MLGGLTLLRRRRPLVSELYSGRQFVGMDLHRRRSVLVRMSESGEHLETVRILNDRAVLAEVMSRAGASPPMGCSSGAVGTGRSRAAGADRILAGRERTTVPGIKRA